jgi:hypothetical protein
MVSGLYDEDSMTAQKHTELVREGDYVAEVDVNLLHEADSAGPGWGPYYSLNDTRKLQSVRRALRSRNLGDAMKLARVCRLTPVSAA